MRRMTIIGHIVKDAEPKEINDGKAICFTVCVNEKYTDKHGVKTDKPYYYECLIWDDNQNILKGCKKGVKMYVEGSPDIRSWIDKYSNSKSIIKIRVSYFEFLSSANNPTNQNTTQNSMQPNDDFTSQGNSQKDDLPF